jgi:hypothetical protein
VTRERNASALGPGRMTSLLRRTDQSAGGGRARVFLQVLCRTPSGRCCQLAHQLVRDGDGWLIGWKMTPSRPCQGPHPAARGRKARTSPRGHRGRLRDAWVFHDNIPDFERPCSWSAPGVSASPRTTRSATSSAALPQDVIEDGLENPSDQRRFQLLEHRH